MSKLDITRLSSHLRKIGKSGLIYLPDDPKVICPLTTKWCFNHCVTCPLVDKLPIYCYACSVDKGLYGFMGVYKEGNCCVCGKYTIVGQVYNESLESTK